MRAGRMVLLGLLLVLAVWGVVGQEEFCPTLVEDALAAVGDNCSGMDRNSACYGFNGVGATFAQAVAENFFTTPADRSELGVIEAIETAALDVEADRWGIAVLSVQANVPNTLPGQAVVLMLLGEAKVENAVAAGESFAPAEPVEAVTLAATNIRSGPGTNRNVLVSAPAGRVLEADGLSADGEWARVVYEGQTGWVSLRLVDGGGMLSGLPTLASQNQTPMQAFTFSTGFGTPSCEEPPNSLLVQGPENYTVNLTINGADIRLGSTIVFRALPNGDIQLIVFDGHVTADGIVVPTGFTMTVSLDEEGNIDPTTWTDWRPLTAEELVEWQGLEDLSGDFLNYQIVLPTVAEINRILVALSRGGDDGDGGGDVVIGGATRGPAGDGVDCSGFSPTSPLGIMPYGEVSFTWTEVAGASGYQVVGYGGDGGEVASWPRTEPTVSTQPGKSINTGEFGGGTDFFYEVRAFVDGDLACTTARLPITREPEPVVEEKSDLEASWKCDDYNTAKVTWSGALTGEKVTITLIDQVSSPIKATGTGPSGSKLIMLNYYPITKGTVKTESGDSVTLPGMLDCVGQE